MTCSSIGAVKMDPHLYCWIANYIPDFTPKDSLKITSLEAKNYHYISDICPPSWCEFDANNWLFMREMKNLTVLEFPDGIDIHDFSFLKDCISIKKLDLHNTRFTDCSFLLQMQNLKYVYLPIHEQLLNYDLLRNCKFHVRLDAQQIKKPYLVTRNAESNFYAQVIFATLKAHTRIPTSLNKFSNGNCIYLNGNISLEQKEIIVDLILRDQIEALYITPFYTKYIDKNLISALSHDFFSLDYPHGCSAVMYNPSLSVIMYQSLSEEKRVAHTTGCVSLNRSVIFNNFSDAARFIDDFIVSGKGKLFNQNDECRDENSVKVDPSLLYWLCSTLSKKTITYFDLDKVTELVPQNYDGQTFPLFPDWCIPEPGNWTIIGCLKNLKKLVIPRILLDDFSFLLKCVNLTMLDLQETNFYDSSLLSNLRLLEEFIAPAAEFPNFDFLLQCKHLRVLDISNTNFRDCRMLLELPELELVRLPTESSLTYREILPTISAQIETSELQSDILAPTTELYYLSEDEVLVGDNGFYAQAMRINGNIERSLTSKAINNLINKLKLGKIQTLTISPDNDFETVVFSVNVKNGWSSMTLQDFVNDIAYEFFDDRNTNHEDKALVNVEGQSPVAQPFSTKNMNLMVECVVHYIKTGKLLSTARWVKYGSEQ